MNVVRISIVAVIFSLTGWLVTLGVANADCTTPGDFGAGAGCAPPGSSSGSGNTESWPPTSVDWPPQLKSDSGSDTAAKASDAKPTPIVMPTGQKAAPDTATSGSQPPSTSTPPKPIVAAG
jgi:hypothetical protein